MNNIQEKKKRGRRKKTETVINEPSNNIVIVMETPSEPTVKRRGRKPKGGKLIVKQPDETTKPNTVTNVILHLKCSLSDLDEYNVKLNQMVTDPLSYNPNIPLNILTYNSDNKDTFSLYDNTPHNNNERTNLAYTIPVDINNTSNSILCKKCMMDIDDTQETDDNINIKDVNYKLKQLKINLYKNNLQDKKSACFWCTYEYDNPSCYIPKYEMDERLFGYGSFCRPECAVAYLMKENLDDSTKFERYHLLNQIYGKVYEHKKNIKPAPNPYYLLDKFYGNLSIQEYRKLLKTEHMLLVVDKPLTRILPELFDDVEDLTMSIYGSNGQNMQSNHSSMYKVKRQSDKQAGPNKNSIIKEKFGLSQ